MHFNCKRNFLKKIILVLFLFCFFIFSFTGCLNASKDNWAKKVGDSKISFPNFLLLTTLEINNVEQDVRKELKTYGDINFEDFKDATIKGGSSIEYLKGKVEEQIKKNLVKIVAAKRLNVKYSKKELNSLQKQAYEQYKAFNESFKGYKIGICLKDCEEYVRVENLEQKILEGLCGKGKSKEIKKEQILSYAKDKNKVLPYTTIIIPKSLENEKVYDEEKEKTDELLLKKHFGVDNIQDLVDKFLKEKKSLQEIEKEFVEGLKKEDFKISGNVEFLEENEKENLFSEKQDKKEKEELIKALKECNEDTTFKVVKKEGGSLQLVKLVNLKDEETEPLQEKIKGILEFKEKDQFLKSIEKEISSKIETNEEVFNDSVVEKQVKKFYKNKTAMNQFPIF